MEGGSSGELITLNVGGRLFHTTRSTLTKHPDSMLSAMFRGGMQASRLCDAQGHPFLDRDPAHFPTILAYLRDGRVPPLPEGRLELAQLKVEAAYYAMTELVAAVEEAEAAAAEQQRVADAHAEQLQYVKQHQVKRLQAAFRAVEEVEERQRQAEEKVHGVRLAQADVRRWQDVVRFMDAGPGRHDAVGAENAAGRLREAELELEMLEDMSPEELQEAQAAADALRRAHLARLFALGADLATAEAELAATHPDVGKVPQVEPLPLIIGPEDLEAGAEEMADVQQGGAPDA